MNNYDKVKTVVDYLNAPGMNCQHLYKVLDKLVFEGKISSYKAKMEYEGLDTVAIEIDLTEAYHGYSRPDYTYTIEHFKDNKNLVLFFYN